MIDERHPWAIVEDSRPSHLAIKSTHRRFVYAWFTSWGTRALVVRTRPAMDYNTAMADARFAERNL